MKRIRGQVIGNFGNIQKSGLSCTATAKTLAGGCVQTVLLIGLAMEGVIIGAREWKLRQMLSNTRKLPGPCSAGSLIDAFDVWTHRECPWVKRVVVSRS